MRVRRGLAVLWLLTAALPAMAQEAATPLVGTLAGQTPVVMLDQERLFLNSRFGKAIMARHEAARATLQAENRRIETALETEERDLTERRAKLPTEEFQKLASEFDAKAEEIRKAQTAKSDELRTRLDAEQRRFADAAKPVLLDMMAEFGAVAILDARAVVLALTEADVTDRAIARLDATLGDGPPPDTAPPPADPPATGP